MKSKRPAAKKQSKQKSAKSAIKIAGSILISTGLIGALFVVPMCRITSSVGQLFVSPQEEARLLVEFSEFVQRSPAGLLGQ